MRKLSIFGVMFFCVMLVAGSSAFAQNDPTGVITAKAHLFKPIHVTVDEKWVDFGKIQGPKSGVTWCFLTSALPNGWCDHGDHNRLSDGKMAKLLLDGPENWDYEIIPMDLNYQTGQGLGIQCKDSQDPSNVIGYVPMFYVDNNIHNGSDTEGTLDENGQGMVQVGGKIIFDATNMGWYMCDLMVTINLVMNMDTTTN